MYYSLEANQHKEKSSTGWGSNPHLSHFNLNVTVIIIPELGQIGQGWTETLVLINLLKLSHLSLSAIYW